MPNWFGAAKNAAKNIDPDTLDSKARRDYFQQWRNAADDQIQDFSLMGKYEQAASTDHFKRAASFAFGSGAIQTGKENFANAFGFLTKHQKNSVLNRLMIPLGAAYLGIQSSIDQAPEDFFGTGLGFAAGLTFARPAAELGHGIGKAARMGGASRILGWGAGGLVGLAAGAATYVATSAALQSYKNDNFVQRAAMSINKDLMTTRGFETNNTLTARQRALSKLSRAGLNDRGQLLGQESMVLRGLM